MMNPSVRSLGLGIAAGMAGTLALLAIIAVTVAYMGSYNIAATEEHTSATRWLFDTTFHNSVEAHAADLTAPDTITPEMVAAGGAEYKAMCQHCHAGPGVERAKWANGMRPRPPHLREAAGEWELKEVFWLVKHGAKMSGMPAFGAWTDDRMLWNVAAFVKQLPAMTPEQYAQIGDPQESASQAGDAH